jgi:hypothetical protein
MSSKGGMRRIEKHALSVDGSREENMVNMKGLSSEPNLKQ